jgi:hypothetical protein
MRELAHALLETGMEGAVPAGILDDGLVPPARFGDAVCEKCKAGRSTVCYSADCYPKRGEVRTFATGATRDQDANKINFLGHLSSAVTRRFCEYMHKHRRQSNGEMRAADNWKKGMPMQSYVESMYRHFQEVMEAHQGIGTVDVEDALCALRFNVDGYLYEHLKARGVAVDKAVE